MMEDWKFFKKKNTIVNHISISTAKRMIEEMKDNPRIYDTFLIRSWLIRIRKKLEECGEL
ncbi:MAG: hypothetical protein ACTSXD_12415 [Candidatus Heimdallarchaeaceae archaeon]